MAMAPNSSARPTSRSRRREPLSWPRPPVGWAFSACPPEAEPAATPGPPIPPPRAPGTKLPAAAEVLAAVAAALPKGGGGAVPKPGMGLLWGVVRQVKAALVGLVPLPLLGPQ